MKNAILEDKRRGEKPIPDDLDNYLNDAQNAMLHQIERFGWSLKFIRRPVFQDPVVIVTNADNSKVGILDNDGQLDLETEVNIRK